MSRFNDFIHFEDRQVTDVVTILQNNGVTADVFRPTYTGDVGFDTEVGDPAKLKRILVHLSNSTKSTKRQGDEALSVTPTEFLGLTDDTDVRIDDLWRVDGKMYRVVALNKSFKNFVQAQLRCLE